MLLLLFLFFTQPIINAASDASSIILRIRWPNGSMGKVAVNTKKDENNNNSLRSIISNFPQYSSLLEGESKEKLKIHDDNNILLDDTKSPIELGLKHGSLLSIISSSPTKSISKSNKKNTPPLFHPFPDLAKKDARQVRYNLARQRQQRKGNASYGDLLERQSNLHTVDPQGKGTIHRVYMCATAAQRFNAGGHKKALLLGTVQRERKNAAAGSRTKTSLSSQPTEDDFCPVAKVHALWEPPDAEDLSSLKAWSRVQKLASYLGIVPIGWIFSYDKEEEDSDDDEKSCLLGASELLFGAQLQIQQMKQRGREEGAKIVTLAMQSSDGATEAFQLSDVCVQMTAEGLLLDSSSSILVTTRHEVIVDGRETKELDPLLCLVNTALLSHEGMYVLSTKSTIKKKTGTLTLKTRKALLKALEEEEESPPKKSKNKSAATKDTSSLLSLLCDFSTLLVLDKLMGDDTKTEELCQCVSKWARGQKKGTQIPATLQRTLQSLLSS